MISHQVALDASGIVPTHQECFKTVASLHDVFIMARNVNKLCTSLIAHDFPTKGMSVHGKSSDWGPQAGLICVNQELSKYQGRARVAALNQEVEHSLGAHGRGDVEATPLILPGWRLDELKQLGLVVAGKTSWANVTHGRYVKVTELRCPGRPHTFTARDTGQGIDFEISVHLNGLGEGEPVQVIRRRGCIPPLTADYDLFCVCPNFKVLDLGREDRYANARADLPEAGRFAANHGVNGKYQVPVPQNFGQKSVTFGSFKNASGGQSRAGFAYEAGAAHEVLGHTSMRQEFIRKQLNALINQTYRGGDTVHHGSETMNPFPEADDFGITVFSPNRDTIGLQSIADLNLCYAMLRQRGYYMHVNPLWGWKPFLHDDNVMNVNSAIWP